MKTTYLLLAFKFLIVNVSQSQIKIPLDSTYKLYKPNGIIFQRPPTTFNIDSSNSLNLSVTEVLKAESIFFEKYRDIEKLDPHEQTFSAKQVCQKYYKYARQYFAFTDGTGFKYVLIQLLKFNNSSSDKKKFFPNWENKFVTGYGGFYETSMMRFLVNLSTNKVDYF